MRVLGIISGTSADAIESVLCDISGAPPKLLVSVLASRTVPFPLDVHRRVHAAATVEGSDVEFICLLDDELGERFASAALEVIGDAGLEPLDIDLIGSPGQTIWHAVRDDGSVAGTLQLGDGAIIAERTGITTVHDLRGRDVAAGGQGAPIVAYVDWLLFRHATAHRAIQNLGGIGNVAYLPTPVAAARMTEHIQAIAARTRLAIPVLLGADQEGAWSVMYPASSPGPGNMALGATGDAGQARSMYEVIGAEIRAVGLHASFAPCADCNRNPRNAAIGTRSFGQRPELVADMTAAAVGGMLAAGAIPTLKHYPGHGDTSVDSHRGLPTVTRDRDELFAVDLLPFARGVAAGAPLVMTAHILFPALDAERPATLSPIILDDILRGELGFDGAVISDSMNMHSMRTRYDPLDAAIGAFRAGVDILMLAEEHYDHDSAYLSRQVELIEGLRSAVRDGRLPEKRVDEAVARVLRLKSGLDLRRETAPETVGSAEHRAVELAAARKAVAVLRGSSDLLPFPAGEPLTVVNTTLRSAYAILGATRGIGPNQTDAAFDLFVAAVTRRSPGIRVVPAEDVLAGVLPDEAGPIVAVTENHPLPGVDFDQSAKHDVLGALAGSGRPVQVVALRDPYELADLTDVRDYLCAFGSRWCSAEAAAEVLFGETAATGASPVSVPGTGIEAR